MSSSDSSGGPAAPRAGSSNKTTHGKLHHKTPSWIPEGSRFHIRIRLSPKNKSRLTDPAIASLLLKSFLFNHERGSWHAWLVVLMPDHIHAILSFPPAKSMSRVIGDWKKFSTKTAALSWQENYFDHRLRNDDKYMEKAHYIRMNPVRAGLCTQTSDWPWILEPWKIDTRVTEPAGHLGRTPPA